MIEVVFDRETGEVRHSARRLTGRHARRWPLAEVSGVRTQIRRRTSPRVNRLMVETAAGPIPLEKGFGPTNRIRIAETVNAWFSEASPARLRTRAARAP